MSLGHGMWYIDGEVTLFNVVKASPVSSCILAVTPCATPKYTFRCGITEARDHKCNMHPCTTVRICSGSTRLHVVPHQIRLVANRHQVSTAL
jgi:hypothetical protein